MGWQKTRALSFALGIGVGTVGTCYFNQAPALENNQAAASETLGSTALSSSAETTLPTTTTTAPRTTVTTFSVTEAPHPLTTEEGAENEEIIANQLVAYFNGAGTPVVYPINEHLASVTEPNELMVAYKGCGAIIAINNWVIASGASSTISTSLRKMNISLYGDLELLANGANYVPEAYGVTYSRLKHADPASTGNSFNLEDSASIQQAVTAIGHTVIAGCETGTIPNHP